MLKFANFTLVVVTLVTASMLYSLEHVTRGYERDINRAKAQMVDNAEAIKLLKAEWSSLTRPERLQQLAERHLTMMVVQPDQYVGIDDLPARLKALVPAETPAGKGTIDDLLKKMQ